MRNIFTEHPLSMNETYVEHFKIASTSGIKLISAGIACVIHSFLPFLFKSTTSNTVRDISKIMENRNKKNHSAI